MWNEKIFILSSTDMWTEQYSLKVDKWYTLMARGEDLASTVEDACSTKNEIEK